MREWQVYMIYWLRNPSHVPTTDTACNEVVGGYALTEGLVVSRGWWYGGAHGSFVCAACDLISWRGWTMEYECVGRVVKRD